MSLAVFSSGVIYENFLQNFQMLVKKRKHVRHNKFWRSATIETVLNFIFSCCRCFELDKSNGRTIDTCDHDQDRLTNSNSY